MSAKPFAALAEADHLSLVTYRRDGSEVATPLWFVEADGRLYARTMSPSGKLKRLARSAESRVAPCTADGTTTGESISTRARQLPEGDPAIALAEAALAQRYGAERVRLTRMMEHQGTPLVYLEIEAREIEAREES